MVPLFLLEMNLKLLKRQNMKTLHSQGELDNQPRNYLNQVKVHNAHQQPFQLQKWPIKYGIQKKLLSIWAIITQRK